METLPKEMDAATNEAEVQETPDETEAALAEVTVTDMIGREVTVIPGSCFQGCTALKSITLPEKVKIIDVSAFQRCASLERIVLNEGTRRIGPLAFSNCAKLQCITLPDGLTDVRYGAFDECPELRDVYVTHWHNRLDRMLPKDVLIHTDHVACVTPARRAMAVLAYLTDGREKSGEVWNQCRRYLVRNASKLAGTALRCPLLLQAMLDERIITEKNIDLYHRAAHEAGRPELTAMLLAYQTDVLTNAIVARHREAEADRLMRRQERVVARAEKRAGKTNLNGTVFAASGRLSAFPSREQLKTALAARGAALRDTVTPAVDYLIFAAPTGKSVHAGELGIEMITEAEFLRMLEREGG